MKKYAIVIILVLIACFMMGLYVYEITVKNVPPSEHIFRTISIVCLCIASIIRVFGTKGRRSLDFYEKHYKSEIQGAFINQPFCRKKLLCATRLYDEGNFKVFMGSIAALSDNSRFLCGTSVYCPLLYRL